MWIQRRESEIAQSQSWISTRWHCWYDYATATHPHACWGGIGRSQLPFRGAAHARCTANTGQNNSCMDHQIRIYPPGMQGRSLDKHCFQREHRLCSYSWMAQRGCATFCHSAYSDFLQIHHRKYSGKTGWKWLVANRHTRSAEYHRETWIW